jgi:pyruvate/2-oxoglutarate/acetoin dehydrogenase E1 component
MRVVEELRNSLFSIIKNNPATMVIGEDVLDPYGGAFKVTQGLSSAFPSNVMTMPISESAIVGLGLGMAMRGRPVLAEIMFGDFLTLTMDQILNHAAKIEWLSGGGVHASLVIRTPMGGGRGYGATHSQSIEKHFCGIPGLTVLAVNQFSSPGKLLEKAMSAGSPVLFIENKIAYSKLVEPERIVHHQNPDAVVLTYGGVSEICVRCAEALAEDEEIFVNVVPVEQLSPLPGDLVAEAASRSDKVFVVEEGTEGWGFASACSEALLKAGIRPKHFQSIATPATSIPAARNLEEALLPSVEKLSNAILEAM